MWNLAVTASCKVDASGLADAIAAKFKAQEWAVGFEAAHAAWVEYGTDPHAVSAEGRTQITNWAHRKLGLSGDELEAAVDKIIWSIRTRGTAAHPYFRPAFDEILAEVPEMFKKYGNDAPREIGFRLLDLAVQNLTMPVVDEHGNERTITDRGFLRASGRVEQIL